MNRLLAIVRDSIPYVKQLRPHAGSIAACVVMQQLEYWFDKKPEGFYKFMEPCAHKEYREGDSWLEELGTSPDEFRTSFDKVGIRYTSKTAFEASGDKFQDKFYCSYYDKREGRTWYFRNDEKVDAMLDELTKSHKKRPSLGDGKSHLPKSEPPISTNGKSHLHNWQTPDHSTESTTESTSKNTTTEAAAAPSPVAAVAGSSEPLNDEIVSKLTALDVPLRDARALARKPDLCRGWLEYRDRHPSLTVAFVIKKVRAGEVPPSNFQVPSPQQPHEIPPDLKAAADALWSTLTKTQKAKFTMDFNTEWWEKYRDEAYNPRNPLHLEEWMRELTDAKTRQWLEGIK